MSEAVMVRVTRETKVQVEEYVDIKVTVANKYDPPETAAKRLVESMISAGQPVAWTRLKEEAEHYRTHDITAERLPSEPVAAPEGENE